MPEPEKLEKRHGHNANKQISKKTFTQNPLSSTITPHLQ
jgi:hypothetical protein